MTAVPVGPDEAPSSIIQSTFYNRLQRIDGRTEVLEKAGTLQTTGIIVQTVTSGDVAHTPSGDAVFDFVADELAAKIITATAVLDFPSIAAGTIQTLTITVTGAAIGDAVALGPPSGIEANLMWSGWVAAADTVTIRLLNISGAPIDPASATWRATVFK